MNLYKYNFAVTAVPAMTAEDAADRYSNETDDATTNEKDFSVLVPHEDFIKIFRLARTLYEIEQYTAEDVEVLVEAYSKNLGYNLSKSDLWYGILLWAERLMDMDDEDIEDWLN